MRAKFIFSEVTRYSLAALWLYAATVKLIDHNNFVQQLSLSPLLLSFAGIISIALPVTELVIAILLIISTRTRLSGMYASFCLLLLFTFYISYLFLLASEVPCACVGIFKLLGWIQHLELSLCGALLCIIAIRLYRNKSRPAPENSNQYSTSI